MPVKSMLSQYGTVKRIVARQLLVCSANIHPSRLDPPSAWQQRRYGASLGGNYKGTRRMSCLQYKKRDIKSVAHAAKLLAAFESGGILTPSS